MTCHQYSLLKRFKRENLERNKRTSAFDSAAAYDMSTILRYVEDKIYLIAHKHQLLALLYHQYIQLRIQFEGAFLLKLENFSEIKVVLSSTSLLSLLLDILSWVFPIPLECYQM